MRRAHQAAASGRGLPIAVITATVYLGAMEIRWLEDFLSLVETRNFSRSAEARYTTQPAFSRRIKSLEEWVGAAHKSSTERRRVQSKMRAATFSRSWHPAI